MVDKSVQYIQGPKHSGNEETARGVRFSPNNKMMALIEKNTDDGKDVIGLYDLSHSLDPNYKGP